MGKHKQKAVLKTIFRDIANIADLIEDSKKIEKSLKHTNFDKINETDKVIGQTKKIILRLKEDVTRISEYFDENCNNWQSKIVKDNSEANKDGVKESLVSDTNIKDRNNETEHVNEPSIEENFELESDTIMETNDAEDPDAAIKMTNGDITIDSNNDTLPACETNETRDSANHKSLAKGIDDVLVQSVQTINDDSGDITLEPENEVPTDVPDETRTSSNLESGVNRKDGGKSVADDTGNTDVPEQTGLSENEKNGDMEEGNSSLHETDVDVHSEGNKPVNDESTNRSDIPKDSEKAKLPDSVEATDKADAESLNESESSQITDEASAKTIDVTPAVKKESKVFLKCIDISKLKTLPTTAADDSVLVISDSEPDNDDQSNKKKVSTRNNTAGQKQFNFVLATPYKQTSIDGTFMKIGNELTISKINKNLVKNNVVQKETSLQKINGTSKSDDPILNNKSKTTKKPATKDSLKSVELVNIDSSSCESDSSYKRKKEITRLIRKLPRPLRRETLMLNAQNDKKFGYKAYVPLPRYRCEKLKALYLKKMEHDDIRRLTDLNNLKKRKRDKRKESDTSASEKGKSKMKCKRPQSKDSHSSKNSDVSDSGVSIPKENIPVKEINGDPAKVILKDVTSATDASASENDKTKKKKRNIKSKKETSSSDDDKKKKRKKDSSDSDDKKKRKWRNDKLLRKNVISDSDSEDEFAKFKKQREKSKSEVKKRLAKTRAKKVIDSSDSSSKSDSGKKKKKKIKSESSEKSSLSSSSSSSDSDSSDHRSKKDTAKSKKGGRIKRMKDSSADDDDDDDKTTRKTIRKVIGQESLQETTKQAEKDERERKARIAERQKKYNAIFDPDKLADSTVEKLVLDFDEGSKKELLSVNKDIVKKLKPHQAKGIQFLWDACFESLERIKTTNGSGCILAHCMGLGKTLQVIALVHTLIMKHKKTGVEKVMVVCPVNTVLNWVDEFKKWLSDLDGPEIEIYELVSNKQNTYRQYLVKQWTKHGGVLIIGYDMFRNLTNPSNKRMRKQMREVFHAGMVDPGPDLIVCDEGHLLKNEKTHLSVAISRVRTERRIVLTGTPMQNNLKEYYCMVQFVKPNLLGTYKEYLNRFVNPITNGQYTDSTPHDISIMRKRSHVLHKMLDGIVQRKDYNVLAPFLPPKYEYVLFLKLSETQIKLYQHYMDNFARRPVESKLRKTAFLFSDFQEFQRICTHPRVLLIKSIENKKKEEKYLDDSEEESEGSLKDFIDDEKSVKSSTTSSSSSSDENSGSDKSSNNKNKTKKDVPEKSGKRITRTAAAAAGCDVADVIDCDAADDVANEWWRQFVDGDELENIALGAKLYLLFEILQQCEIIGDKILVFSQSLYSLNIIEHFLSKVDEATQDGKNETVSGFSGSWALGLDYFRIDGSSSCDNRAAWCKHFNDPDNIRARLFLISTKAGGLGINLFGANRVIIFDVSWNPSHDTQSIYRVYRFGQTKPCYIYRFVTWGSMEMKIYERQVTKQAISKRVIDEQQIDRHYNQNDLAELYNFEPYPAEAPTPLLPKDILLAELLQKEKERIYKYHEHQSLLENKEEEELDEAERKAAWDEYENEKTNPPVPAVNTNSNVPGGWISNLPMVSINAALLNILQRDNPTWTREQVQAVIPIVTQQLREQVEKGEPLLYNRIVKELKQIQIQQQQKLQQYYIQQQLRMLQQQQLQKGVGPKPSVVGNVQNFRSVLSSVLNAAPKTTNASAAAAPKPINDPNEIVDLND